MYPPLRKSNVAPVLPSPEFDRVRALPFWDETPLIDEDALKKKNGKMSLRPLQLRALSEAFFAGGLIGSLGVGTGKTLICALLPTVLDKRALILVPASLRDQTTRLIVEYSSHWHIRRDLHLLSYEDLSRHEGENKLRKVDPELVICDEVHNLRSRDAARTKRLLRFFKERPWMLFCGTSGTITKRSISDYAHLAKLALGEGSPLPIELGTLLEWAEALDVSDRPRNPGVLLKICPDVVPFEKGHLKNNSAVRESFGKRLRATMGFVTSTEDSLGTSLVIEVVKTPPSPTVDAARHALAKKWELPDGRELISPLDVSRADKQLRLGGYYRWVTPPPRSWLEARGAWHKALHAFLKKRSSSGLDSPFLVVSAIRRGDKNVQFLRPLWAAWHEEKAKIPYPATEWVWVDENVSSLILAKLLPKQPTIVWTDIVSLGYSLKLPWYGAGDDRIISDPGVCHIAASIKAHGVGKNLFQFSSNLVLSMGPSGDVMEQLIGRTHRSGQTADEVRVVILDLFKEELLSACKDAEYIQAITHNPQKLLYANRVGW